MKKRILFPLVIGALLAGACEKIIDFKPEQITPGVVMLSRPAAGDQVGVTLTYSRFFLDGHEFPSIADATLTLDVNGNVYTPDTAGQGYYRFPYTVQSGDTMTLHALVPGMDEPVTASTRVPETPTFYIVSHIMDTTDEWYSHVYYKTRIAIEAPTPNCYYAIRVLMPGFDYDNVIDTTNYYYHVFESSDALLSNNTDVLAAIEGDDGSFYGQEAIVGSELFQNGRHEFTLEYNEYFDFYNEWDPVREVYVFHMIDVPIRIEIRSISPELYNYNRSAQTTDIFDQLLGEPVQVICNVQGGIGVFGSSCSKQITCPTPIAEDFHHDNYYYGKKGATRPVHKK